MAFGSYLPLFGRRPTTSPAILPPFPATLSYSVVGLPLAILQSIYQLHYLHYLSFLYAMLLVDYNNLIHYIVSFLLSDTVTGD